MTEEKEVKYILLRHIDFEGDRVDKLYSKAELENALKSYQLLPNEMEVYKIAKQLKFKIVVVDGESTK